MTFQYAIKSPFLGLRNFLLGAPIVVTHPHSTNHGHRVGSYFVLDEPPFEMNNMNLASGHLNKTMYAICIATNTIIRSERAS